MTSAPLAHGQTTVRSFQSGTLSFTTSGGTATTVTATISAVTTTQAVLFFSTSANSTAVKDFDVSGTITNSTTLTFTRGAGTTVTTVQWYVVEFSSGVTVQRGSTTINVGQNTTNVTLAPAVNLANSFPIISTSQNTTAGNSLTASNEVTARLTSTTQLRVSTGANVANANVTVQWQVVSYTNSNVQSGQTTMATGANSATQAIASVTTADSWLVYTLSETGGSPNPSAVTVRGQLDSSTNSGTTSDEISFDRPGATGSTEGALTINWFVISFTDGTTVQQGTQNFSTGVGPTTDDVMNVQITPGICQLPVGGGEGLQSGRTDYATDTNLGADLFTFSLAPGASFLQMTRANAAGNADVPWWVVQFTSCTNPTVTQSSPLASVGAGTTVTVPVVNGPSAASGLTINDLLLPNWQIGVAYTAGQFIVYDGTVYRCATANTSAVGNEPPNSTADWTAVTQWQAGVAYTTANYVIFDSIIYKCFTAHTSKSVPSNEPPNNTADWTAQTTPATPNDFVVSNPAVAGTGVSGTCSVSPTIGGIQCTGVGIPANGTATLTYTITPSVAADVTSFATATGSTGASGAVALGTNLPGTNTYIIPVEGAGAGFCLNPPPVPAPTAMTGVVDTYYPGSGRADAGATSITVGATSTPGSSTGISSGDLLLVIQMQNASFNSSNGVTYGDGLSGAGYTALNNVGQYEFVQATSSLASGSAGTINIKGAGANNGLVHSYLTSAYSTSAGQSTFQVIRVPSFQDLTMTGTMNAVTWNGSVGGVAVLDVAGTLTFSGSSPTIDVSAQGFRGAVGMQLTGDNGFTPTPAYTDFAYDAPAGITAPNEPTAGVHASKGEGIAGTPRYNILTQNYPPNIEVIGSTGDSGVEGYPGGSMGKGAPGNAGGGGSDHDPQTATPGGNDENSGGGGGGNGGAGGHGGDTWNTTKNMGGMGGAAFLPSVDAVVMGGGGGAGTRNNNNGLVVSAGGVSGGGIVILRAGLIAGAVTINANGLDDTEVTLNDGGGGGGAGGTVVILSQNGLAAGSNLTINAFGGKGGTAWLSQALGTCNATTPPGAAGNNAGFDANGNPLRTGPENQNGGGCAVHGPGGGGGGGVVITTANLSSATVNVSGGAPGVTTAATNPTIVLDATAGANGIFMTTSNPSVGTSATSSCVDWGLSMTDTGGSASGSTAAAVVGGFNSGFPETYNIVVSSGVTAGSGSPTITFPLPAGITAFGTPSGTGWTCTVLSNTVTCTRTLGDALPANSSYPAITVPVTNVSATSGTVTATATLTDGAITVTAVDQDDIINPLIKTDSGKGTSGNQISGTGTIAPATGALYANFSGQYYTLIVTNSTSTSFPIGTTVTDPAPSGMTFGTGASAPSGTGWDCSASTASNVSCTSTAAIAAGATTTITININGFTTGIGGTISNTASLVISGATACTSTSPCAATDTDTVKQGFYEKIVDSGSGSADSLSNQTRGTFYTNAKEQYVLTIQNLSNVTAPGSVKVTFPTTITGETLGTPGGSGWTCASAGGTWTCTRTGGDLLSAGSYYPEITIPVTTVTSTACANGCISLTGTVTAGTNGNISLTATDADNVVGATTTMKIAKTQAAEGSGTFGTGALSVTQGDYVNYQLVVTNSTGATQTNVTMTDTLDPSLVYSALSTSTTGGATFAATPCTTPTANGNGGGTITCTISSIPNGATATVIIAIQVGIPPQSSPISNYATVSYTGGGASSGPVTLNVTYPSEPTSIDLVSFDAYQDGGAAVIRWTTDHETRNLGFNIYRENDDGSRAKLNPSLIAGSALKFKNARPDELRTYVWRDNNAPDAGTRYFIEDVETGGTRAMHGPVEVEFGPLPAELVIGGAPHTTTLHELNEAVAATSTVHQYRASSSVATANAAAARLAAQAHTTQAADTRGGNASSIVCTHSMNEVLSQIPPNASLGALNMTVRQAIQQGLIQGPIVLCHTVTIPPPQSSPQTVQLQLASGPAVKISVTQDGWYEIPQAELVAAGFDPTQDPRSIRLFAEGQEQPLELAQAGSPHAGMGAADSIQFYGTGLDLPSTGTHVYWLVQGEDVGEGARIQKAAAWGYDRNAALSSFPYTLTWEDRSVYLAALTTGTQNFFGEIIASQPVQQTFNVAEFDVNSNAPAQLTVSVQGVIDQQAHDVRVNLNGTDLGGVVFHGMTLGTQSFTVPRGLLHDGANVVALTPEDGDLDISVVNFVDLTYPRLFVADGNQLQFTVPAGSSVDVTGFTNPGVRVIDITTPSAPEEIEPEVFANAGSYQATLRVPGTPGQSRTLLAFTKDAAPTSESLAANTPSSWYKDAGRQIVMIAYPDFIPALTPLVNLRQSQGYSVGVVDVNSIYDEFNYGEHGADAIKNFLAYAQQHWTTKPKYVLLVGGASLDPRNFLGFGDLDFVPTEMVATQQLMTSSDGALVDFQNSGIESIPIGRLPVRTVADAENVVSKIVGYETAAAAPWQQQMLFVAGHDTQQPFEVATQSAENAVPENVSISTVLLDNVDPSTARSMLLTDWQQGQAVINYLGHGSETVWADGLLSDADANTLDNGNNLPFVISLNCLNGFFHDVYAVSLAQSLLLGQNGGAVAVLASSSLTNAAPQAALDHAMLNYVFKGNTLGTALMNAKQGVADPDVRRSYMLFGDPAMKLR